MKKKLKKKSKKGVGRPHKIINYKTLDSLCRIHCTGEECASILKLKYETMDETIQREKGVNFREYFTEKSAGGKRSLRRKQWSKALAGDNTMLIWLGKQHLCQVDKQEINENVNIKQELQLKIVHVEIQERISLVENDLQQIELKTVTEAVPGRSEG